MRHQLIAVLMALAIVGDQLLINWTPHEANTQLRVHYTCDKDADQGHFYAVNAWPIEAKDSRALVHRVSTPPKQTCLIIASVMRAPEGWDGDDYKLYVAEWQMLQHVEGK